MKKVLSIMGTRPEIIKMAPVVRELQKYSDIESIVLATSQHREMADQMFREFAITPDIDLDIMIPNQTLAYVTSRIASDMESTFKKINPDVILVQGDTTSACICALIAFYHKIPVGHVEAGLRTYDPGFPFPEEINRQLISRIATFNFVPTRRAMDNLLNEKTNRTTIYFTGNTVVDSLLYLLETRDELKNVSEMSADDGRVILVTAHRRENFGAPMENICGAINDIAERFDDVKVVFPVHPNPNVREMVYNFLSGNSRIELIEPLDYTSLIKVMASATVILTDSGGIQEESPTLHKPVLVLRNETERPEVVEAGGAILVGPNREVIVRETSSLLTDRDKYRSMVNIKNPFGDGKAAPRIIEILRNYFNLDIEEATRPLEEYYAAAGDSK